MYVVAGQFADPKRNSTGRRRFHGVRGDQPRLEIWCPLQFVNRPLVEASTLGNRRFRTIERFRGDDEANATVVQRGEGVGARERVDFVGEWAVKSRPLTAVAVHNRSSVFE